MNNGRGLWRLGSTSAHVVAAVLVAIVSLSCTSAPSIAQNTVQQPARPFCSVELPQSVVVSDSSGYAMAKMYVHNTAQGVLTISSVVGSCGCATASVQRNNISGTTKALVLLNVNTSALAKGTHTVEYTVTTNASNAVTIVQLTVIKQ
jgi:hypothetical protein